MRCNGGKFTPPVECLGFTAPTYQPRPLLWPKAQAKMRIFVICLVASALTETVYLLVLNFRQFAGWPLDLKLWTTYLL